MYGCRTHWHPGRRGNDAMKPRLDGGNGRMGIEST
jgi:hypothetical protein